MATRVRAGRAGAHRWRAASFSAGGPSCSRPPARSMTGLLRPRSAPLPRGLLISLIGLAVVVAVGLWTRLHTTVPGVLHSGSSGAAVAADGLTSSAQHESLLVTTRDATTFDLVLVFTVWRRQTLEQYFQYLERQDFFALRGPHFRVNVLVFQNSNHVDVASVVGEWSSAARWGGRDVTVTFVQSPMATGYYGRFLAPLMTDVRKDTYWVITDDDLIWGAHYITNLLRVVDAGQLAVRVGRFIVPAPEHGWADVPGASAQAWVDGAQVAFEEDVVYDFGGQMWAGRIAWLRKAWQHPPTTLVTAEDFWISAVLGAYHDIKTARPRCPAADLEACACSMREALNHKSAEIGATVDSANDLSRQRAVSAHMDATGYSPVSEAIRQVEASVYNVKSAPVARHWNLTEWSIFSNCLWFS